MGPSSGNYVLMVEGFQGGGGLGDEFNYNSGYGFSTSDHDVDPHYTNCASTYGGY